MPSEPPRAVDSTPHRMHYASTYTHPIPEAPLRDYLRMAHRLRELGEPFSFEAACVSILLDTDRDGRMKAKADYQRLWGWTRQQLRDRWVEIVAMVEQWRTAYGRTRNQTGTIREPIENHKDEDSAKESHGKNHARTNEEPIENQLTTTDPEPDPEEKNPPSPPEGGRGAERPSAVPSPPDPGRPKPLPSKRSRPAKLSAAAVLAAIPIPTALDSERFREAWAAWIPRRMAMKNRPVDPVDMFTRQLAKCVEHGHDAAVWVIGESLENGWQGLIWERTTTTTNGPKPGGPNGNGHQGNHRGTRDERSPGQRLFAAIVDRKRAGAGASAGASAERGSGGDDPDVRDRAAVEPRR